MSADRKQAVPRKTPARSKQQLKRATLSHVRSLSKRPKRIRSTFQHQQFRHATSSRQGRPYQCRTSNNGSYPCIALTYAWASIPRCRAAAAPAATACGLRPDAGRRQAGAAAGFHRRLDAQALAVAAAAWSMRSATTQCSTRMCSSLRGSDRHAAALQRDLSGCNGGDLLAETRRPRCASCTCRTGSAKGGPRTFSSGRPAGATTATSSPRWRSAAATSSPMKPAPPVPSVRRLRPPSVPASGGRRHPSGR